MKSHQIEIFIKMVYFPYLQRDFLHPQINNPTQELMRLSHPPHFFHFFDD
jgi:hypothetical protein